MFSCFKLQVHEQKTSKLRACKTSLPSKHYAPCTYQLYRNDNFSPVPQQLRTARWTGPAGCLDPSQA
jgi:hypothetical protein